jgi:iron complex outermembrane receptor protein
VGATLLLAPPAAATAPEASAPAPAGEAPAAGDDAAADAPELLLWQEIPTVVTASRRPEPVTRAPNAVSVISDEDIHASGLMVLGETLRLAPGVDVGRLSNWQHAIGVRGLHGQWSNKTLVLMDGRTLYDPVFGGVRWDAVPVLLEDIDRIEVVRGPGGAAWGANAANGVINIITKKPKDTQGFFLSQTLTSRLDSLTHMRYGLSEGPLDLRLSAGYDSMPELGVREGDGLHDFARIPRVNLRATYRLDEQRRIDFDAGYLDSVLGHPNDPAGSRWFPQVSFFRTRYTWEQGPDDSWYVQYYLNRRTVDQSRGGVWTRTIQHDVEAVRTQPLGDRHTLTWGGNVRIDQTSSGDPFAAGETGIRFDNERTHNHQAGLFIQDRFEACDDWTFVLGARADRNSWTGWEWAGRGTVLYHPADEHTFRASVARAFRTPSLGHRVQTIRQGALPFPPGTFALQLLGNEDLNASYVKAYEFGYTWAKKPVRADVQFFWNNYRGVVQLVPTTAPGAFPVVERFQNRLDGDLYGVELSGAWQATDRLALDAFYVWEQWVQSGTRTFRQPELQATGEMAPPQQRLSIGARYTPTKDLALNGRMWWVDEVHGNGGRRIDPYARFDFNVAHRLGEHAEIAVGVLNAFDPRHPEAESSGFAANEVGERTWYVRFQADF